MVKRFTDDERALLSRLLENEDDDEDQTEETEDDDEDEFVYRGKRYRAVAEEPEPVKKAAPAKKAAAKKAAPVEAEPEQEPAPRKRRFVS